MKVRTLKKWHDYKEDIIRSPDKDSEFICSKQRFKEITDKLGDGYVEEIKEEKKDK